jgi:GNAT superfamily N-acetyltransferase
MDVRIEWVDPDITLPLRWRVLRPHLDPDQIQPLPGERRPGARHLAALTPDGRVVGTAVLMPERFTLMADREPAWRLRGMATDESVRGQGVGAQVLATAIDFVAAGGGGLLWCHARLPAVRFYERAGLRRLGVEWDEPHIGRHVCMWRDVPAASSSAS